MIITIIVILHQAMQINVIARWPDGYYYQDPIF